MKKKNWIPGIMLAAVLALTGCGGAAQANNADTGSSSDIQKSEEKRLFRGNGGLKTSTTPVFIPIRQHSTFG